MQKTLLAKIEKEFGITIVHSADGPRGFVAETHILEMQGGNKYFCKVVNKPVFIAQLRRSLPILNAIHDIGFSQMPYPIKTADGSLYSTDSENLIVVFNYIDAPQNYEYDNFAFGQLTAQTHQLTDKLKDIAVPNEDFVYEHQALFEDRFLTTRHDRTEDTIEQAFQAVLQKHRSEIVQYYQLFAKKASECKSHAHHFVITHGDSPGNTLVKTPTDLYIIDWDDILLAPAERDLWFLDHKPDFLAGYRSIFPNYTIDETARTFCVLNYHFNSIMHFYNEIFSAGDITYRRSNMEKLAEHLSEKSWIYHYLHTISV